MGQVARVVAPGRPHHVIQLGNRRQPTFFRHEDYGVYIDLMAQWFRKLHMEIWAYCLMQNHVHLVAVPDSKDGLAKAVGEAHHLSSEIGANDAEILRLHERTGRPLGSDDL